MHGSALGLIKPVVPAARGDAALYGYGDAALAPVVAMARRRRGAAVVGRLLKLRAGIVEARGGHAQFPSRRCLRRLSGSTSTGLLRRSDFRRSPQAFGFGSE